ncbi:MAG: RNA methyltransferase [Candidatus Omnitrophica bacterium]|nr:RNA methyltransferase [Candidatus Omnitrophota bacterium]
MKLYGKNPVIERLRSDPASVRKLYLQRKTDLSEVVRAAKSAGVDFESVDKAWFERSGGTVHTQGVMAEVDDFVYTPFQEVLEDCSKARTTLVFLDGITDPQNMGGIFRSLACIGGFSVVIPEFDSAEVNETVMRVACGGENYLKIARVPNLVKAAGRCRDKGITIYGTVVDGGEEIGKVKIKRPLVIIIGSEGKGIRPGLLKCIDKGLFLPMKGAPLSFNASVAAALVAYEISKVG